MISSIDIIAVLKRDSGLAGSKSEKNGIVTVLEDQWEKIKL